VSEAEEFVVAIDLGTTGLKVGLVSLTGRIAWTDDRQLTTTLLPNGGATQDAAEWWTLVCEAVRKGMASGAVPAEQVVGISTTGQWASTIPVDAAGRPVGDCLLWMDTRGARYARKLIAGPVAGYAPRRALTWIRHTGGAPSTTGADPIGHILYLAHERPDVHAAARWFLEPVDYLSMRFTGIAAATHASMTAAWLTDNRDLERMEYDATLVKLAGVELAKLPPLKPTGNVVGTVLDEVATDLGLPPGVKVIAGTPDLHSATVGAGAMHNYETHLTVSTTAWISCPVPFKKTDAIRQVASVPGLAGLQGHEGHEVGQYLVANNHETAGRCLQWLRDSVFGGGVFGADLGFTELGSLAAGAPPGSGGIIFTPWLAGERSPVDDHYARGGFHNLSLTTGRADLVRAVMEGVAYNARWLHEAVERFTKRRLDPIRIFGGGAQSDLWCQIHADVMDRTIERVAEPLHTGLRGAGIFAGLALGVVKPSDVRELVPVDRVFRPDPGTRAEYDRLYAEYPKLYAAQKGMFARLNRPRRK
jgi:xylulokinase